MFNLPGVCFRPSFFLPLCKIYSDKFQDLLLFFNVLWQVLLCHNVLHSAVELLTNIFAVKFNSCISLRFAPVILLHLYGQETNLKVFRNLCWVSGLSPKHQKIGGVFGRHLFFRAKTKHDSIQVFIPCVCMQANHFAQGSENKGHFKILIHVIRKIFPNYITPYNF